MTWKADGDDDERHHRCWKAGNVSTDCWQSRGWLLETGHVIRTTHAVDSGLRPDRRHHCWSFVVLVTLVTPSWHNDDDAVNKANNTNKLCPTQALTYPLPPYPERYGIDFTAFATWRIDISHRWAVISLKSKVEVKCHQNLIIILIHHRTRLYRFYLYIVFYFCSFFYFCADRQTERHTDRCLLLLRWNKDVNIMYAIDSVSGLVLWHTLFILYFLTVSFIYFNLFPYRYDCMMSRPTNSQNESHFIERPQRENSI